MLSFLKHNTHQSVPLRETAASVKDFFKFLFLVSLYIFSNVVTHVKEVRKRAEFSVVEKSAMLIHLPRLLQ